MITQSQHSFVPTPATAVIELLTQTYTGLTCWSLVMSSVFRIAGFKLQHGAEIARVLPDQKTER